jgi:hypothetical protein
MAAASAAVIAALEEEEEEEEEEELVVPWCCHNVRALGWREDGRTTRRGLDDGSWITHTTHTHTHIPARVCPPLLTRAERASGAWVHTSGRLLLLLSLPLSSAVLLPLEPFVHKDDTRGISCGS